MMKSFLENMEILAKAILLLGLVSLFNAILSYLQIMQLALTLKNSGLVTDMRPYVLSTLMQLGLATVFCVVIIMGYEVLKSQRHD